MIQLTHDKNLVSQLAQSFSGVNQAQVETLDSVLDSRGAVDDQPHHTRNAASQDGSVKDAIVDFFDWCVKGGLCLFVLVMFGMMLGTRRANVCVRERVENQNEPNVRMDQKRRLHNSKRTSIRTINLVSSPSA